MSERTTIGGTVYESIGSSSSNLLLKCNGTARIQWGNRLIDLIKNGKIASGNSENSIYVISDESEIKSDGVYVLSKDNSTSLLICKDDEQYNITNTDLYISTKTKQDLTVEQRQQALENVGMYYNTIEEVQEAGIQNGLVYVLSDQNLYTIKDGVVTEFEAKLKTVTVDKEQNEGEVIKSNVKIVLSVLDTEYIVVGSGQVLVKYPLVISESAAIESENANDARGYRLYIDSNGSHLDVDYINVRTGLPFTEYISITYEEFMNRMGLAQLVPHQWYLIEDYKNPWKLVGESDYRPILIRALTGSMLYPEGKLFKDQRVVLTYDPHYQESIILADASVITAKGRITSMRDSDNNVANFDFLDYTDAAGNPLTTLHPSSSGEEFDSSIFPTDSYNNSLTVFNLKGITLIDGIFNDDNTCTVEFADPETAGSTTKMIMHDNTIICDGIKVTNSCSELINNSITGRTDCLTIKKNMRNSSFESISGPDTDLDCPFDNVKLLSVVNCKFSGEYSVINVTSTSPLRNLVINEIVYPKLFDSSLTKEIYQTNNVLQITTTQEQTFFRGMIVMHSGNASIPEGWAMCDGKTYTYNGISSTTPNLVGRFIKAAKSIDEVGAGGNSELRLEEKHLPAHTHPHLPHTHTISGLTGMIEDSGDLTLEGQRSVINTTTKTESFTAKTTGWDSADAVSKVIVEYGSEEIIGGNHAHSITISGGKISESTSKETTKSWANEAINIEPNYYALIFIMKL